MKIAVICFASALFLCLAAAAQQLPEAEVTVRVVGEDGIPIEGAAVKVGFMTPDGPKAQELKETPVTGLTGVDGGFTASGTCHQDLTATIDKAGYYHGGSKAVSFSKIVDGKWQPWNSVLNVTLKKIEKPIAMYAKKVSTELPIADQPVGFDLMKGDWVAPQGSGKVADLIFKLTRHFVDARNYEATLELSFSSTGDGIEAWDNDVEYYSALKLPRTAPEGGYASSLILSNKHNPGAQIERVLVLRRNYFFRVRTVLDETGKISTAFYGKIDGNIRFSPIRSKTCSLMFTYYLDPEANNRNVEFDPQQDLLQGLTDTQKVRLP